MGVLCGVNPVDRILMSMFLQHIIPMVEKRLWRSMPVALHVQSVTRFVTNSKANRCDAFHVNRYFLS